MPHDALRAGENRVVVREHRAVRAILTNQLAVDASGAGHQSVRRRAMYRSSTLRRPRCAAIARPPYSTKLPSSHRSARFSRAVLRPAAWRASTTSGRAHPDQRSAAQRLCEIGTRGLVIGHHVSLGAPVSCRCVPSVSDQLARHALAKPEAWEDQPVGRRSRCQGAQEDLRVPAVQRQGIARCEDPAFRRSYALTLPCVVADGVWPRQARVDDGASRPQVAAEDVTSCATGSMRATRRSRP